jgi:hypothetical protein
MTTAPHPGRNPSPIVFRGWWPRGRICSRAWTPRQQQQEQRQRVRGAMTTSRCGFFLPPRGGLGPFPGGPHQAGGRSPKREQNIRAAFRRLRCIAANGARREP